MVSELMLTLLVISTLTFAFNFQPVKAEPATWTVDDDGPADFHTIQEAINAANSGDIISVHNGIYYENVVVNKANLTLIGEGRENTIIDGGGAGNVVTIGGSIVNGFTIRNGDGGYYGGGIRITGNASIENNIIVNNSEEGIYSGSSQARPHISGNVIANNSGTGIMLYYGTVHHIISDNVITGNGWHGIGQWASGNNTILRNIIENNLGPGIFSEFGNNIIGNNFVAANGRVHNGIDFRTGIKAPSNNIVFGNTIKNHTKGIWLSDNNVVYHNNLINNTHQAYISAGYTNVWDDGYPSGGNYWSNYAGVDEQSGPNQDEIGSDGIIDASYVIDGSNQDNYPLVNPWVERKVGVEVGDWVKYTVDIIGYRPGFPVDLNDVEWGKTSVQSISGTTIEVELIWHLKNSTEITTTGSVDVVTSGYPGPTSMSGLFISRDLPPGATLYATYPFGAIPPSLKINETIFKEYLGVGRETNHVNATKMGIHIDAYWDKATGVLTEFKETFSTSWSWHLQIVDTNLWKAPVPTTIGELKTEIEELGTEGEIDNQGIVKSLLAKLNVAQKLVDKGKEDEAEMVLNGFIMQVQKLSGIHITPEAADILIQSAEHIISEL